MDTAKTIKLHLDIDPGTDYDVAVVKAEYNKGGIALQAFDVEDGMLFATLTSWLPGIPEGQVAIDDCGVNRGFCAQLIEQGVIALTGETRSVVSVTFPLARVLV